MKCPTCVAEGKTSRLNIKREAGPRTELRDGKLRFIASGSINLGVERFWDEDGKVHVHDHEVRTNLYWCSNDHYHQVALMGECPREECDWNQQPMVKAGREGLK